MTFKYNNVYLNETITIAGPYEKKFVNYFDKVYDELYFGTNSWEDAEMLLLEESVSLLLEKVKLHNSDIDIHISGDLSNQISVSNYAASKLSIPFMGIYAACATSTLSLITASNMISKDLIKNAICSTSSHNALAEKQFRYPVEYGGPKRKTTTFTATGGASAYLSKEKMGFKIESGTIGRVVDYGISDVYHMGAVMAPAAVDTLLTHLKDLKRDESYYDLILTGDLGIYGKKIFRELLKEKGITLTNYDDAGSMLYNNKIYAGASGPVCLPLVTYGYILDEMRKGKYKKVLLIATGALHNTAMCNEKKSIPSVAHAISLEVLK